SRLVTQTSLLLRTATATGSSPTGTRYRKDGDPEVRSKTSSVPLGVFTAKSVLPSADIASGRTCPLSNSTNAGPVAADCAETGFERMSQPPKQNKPPAAKSRNHLGLRE